MQVIWNLLTRTFLQFLIPGQLFLIKNRMEKQSRGVTKKVDLNPKAHEFIYIDDEITLPNNKKFNKDENLIKMKIIRKIIPSLWIN